jgi:hypothetical protein
MKFFKWTVEIEVADTWVEDGFDLTEERLESILQHVLPYSYSHETKGKVLKAPDSKTIRKLQGYAVEAEVVDCC